MLNIPVVKLGIVAVSRDCFPASLSTTRRQAVVAAYRQAGGEVEEIEQIVENEKDALKALEALKAAGANALVVYLGNFGPEGPETILAQRFEGPTMFVAAAEGGDKALTDNRGDAFCGMLNASYNIGLRGLKPYIPEYPVGDAAEVAAMMASFLPVARIMLGLKRLKIFTFGPRPFNFLACNGPIAPLFDLGVEIQENSELDLYASFKAHAGDARIPEVARDMAEELGQGNKLPDVLPTLAQYELTLLDWMEDNLEASQYAAFANKCWPAFQTEFGFVPCYVNSRLTGRLIPVSCEVDIYGALSEYILACATGTAPTLLDINNTVPKELYAEHIKGRFPYELRDTFMGFHCGNTASCNLVSKEISYQRIMHRLLEPDSEPNITRGTLDGDLKDGDITFFRLQSTADCQLKSYVAQGEILPVRTQSFGSRGVFAIPEMARFYRYVLLEKHYPHHGAVAFAHVGSALFSAMRMLGVEDIGYNQPKGVPYPHENPFK